MPQQVPAEKVARLDTRRLQRIDQFGARERRLGSDGDHEPEPRRVRLRGRGVQNQVPLVLLQAGGQRGVVAFSGGYELIDLAQLGHPNGGLHIGHLEVVADVRIDVFVIVTEGKRAELLGEAFAAGVVFAAGAVAIASPIAKAAGDAGEVLVDRKSTRLNSSHLGISYAV